MILCNYNINIPEHSMTKKENHYQDITWQLDLREIQLSICVIL